MPRQYRGLLTTLALPLFFALLSSTLAGQGSVYADAGGSWSVATIGLGGFRCGDTGQALIYKSFSSTSCSGGPNFLGFGGGRGEFESEFFTEANAHAVNGHIGAESIVNWFINKKDSEIASRFNQTSAGGTATARWEDQVRFSPIGPTSRPLGFMDITFRVTGGINANPDLIYVDPYLGSHYAGSITSTVSFGGNTQGSSFFSSQVIRMGSITSAMPPMPTYQTLHVAVNGFVSNPFSILLGTQSVVNVTSEFYVQETMMGFLQTLYNHTAVPVSYVLFDDQGTDVTSLYNATFDNGLQFDTQQSVVPEPSTVALMTFGLCGLFALQRRSRRKTCA